ncbi:predicted protein [Coccidioides posadasii str. Silveira]|uniref:Predicted protein n=1 Tax=Coccidioides posadasii (strain RMSCC 757 / Silveira) TaxID=443226 RepID=E9DIQ5_COCPS|nr:predicted protein [Coccidioides posadasii str. Silveira]
MYHMTRVPFTILKPAKNKETMYSCDTSLAKLRILAKLLGSFFLEWRFSHLGMGPVKTTPCAVTSFTSK